MGSNSISCNTRNLERHLFLFCTGDNLMGKKKMQRYTWINLHCWRRKRSQSLRRSSLTCVFTFTGTRGTVWNKKRTWLTTVNKFFWILAAQVGTKAKIYSSGKTRRSTMWGSDIRDWEKTKLIAWLEIKADIWRLVNSTMIHYSCIKKAFM